MQNGTRGFSSRVGFWVGGPGHLAQQFRGTAMKASILGLLAETPVHPGVGRGMGVVDLPVARENSTSYPVLVGSSLKGALRDKAKRVEEVDRKRYFGKLDCAGDLLVSDARLLLLPIRSLTGQYRWATCPYLIERYSRDLARAKHTLLPALEKPKKNSVLASGKGKLFLEERQFNIDSQPSPKLVEIIGQLILHDETRHRLTDQITILCDNDFSWFARYGLTIQARNTLDDDTKQSKNLWYEETLPPDTVMYGLILGRSSNAIETLQKLFPEEDPYLQVGGNETVGQGWFAVKVSHNSAGGKK